MFEPTYDDLVNYYDNTEEFQLLKVDSLANKKTKIKFMLQSYPTVLLYNRQTKEAKKFTAKRNILSLINFINDNTNAINHEIKSNVNVVNDISDLTLSQELVVFTLSSSKVWEEYEYPTHFYQQLSYEYNYKFSIVFVDQLKDNEILSKFMIGNYPSVVYFTSPEKFKTFKTFSSNHAANDKLTESSLVDFLSHVNDESTEYGTWFNSSQELEDYVKHQKYEFAEVLNMGFNVNLDKGHNDDDKDYLEMMDELNI